MNNGMKRLAKIAALVLLLALDSAITWRLSADRVERTGGVAAVSEGTDDPLAAFRLEREQLLARQEAELKDIIYSQNSEDQIVSQAQRQLMTLLAHARDEKNIEGILQSRGFEDVIVSIADGSASVMVRGPALSARQSAVILELVIRQTGLTGGNVKIVPVK